MMLKELMIIMKQCLMKDLMDQLLMKIKKVLARELARMNLTLNTYTQWYWKTDLLNLMNFLRLRADSHAQYEIRVYAEACWILLKNGFQSLMLHLWIIE